MKQGSGSKNRREFLSDVTLASAALVFALYFKPKWLWAHGTSRQMGKHLSTPQYSSLLKELSVKHAFSSSELKNLFSKARLHSIIPKFFAKPPEDLPYSEYRPRHITPAAISNGRVFMKKHRTLFNRAESTYEVDPYVIGGILGVETKFGRFSEGRFKVFDALNTIFSDIPRKQAFARRELIEFLLLCREEGLNPIKVKGSFAGAMGMPQFIPSSYRMYAVDFDGDGRRDLWRSHQDVVGSVAHYLKHHGWKKDGPVVIPVTLNKEDPFIGKLVDRGLKEKTTVKKLQSSGVSLESSSQAIAPKETVSLIRLNGENGQVVAIFSNFRTILKYNYAINYVMAVSDFAAALKKN